MPRLVRAEQVDDVAERLALARNLALEEAVLLEDLSRSLDVAVDVEHAGRGAAVGRGYGRDQPCAGHEQRLHAVPVARLAGRPRDHVVERGYNSVHRLHI